MRGERDEAARAAVLAALRAGAAVTTAARGAGLARQTPYQWARRGDEEMREALEQARARGGRGRRRSAPREPRPAPAVGSEPRPAAAGDSDRRERALAVLEQLMLDVPLPARDRIAAAGRLMAGLPSAPAPVLPEAVEAVQAEDLRARQERAALVERARRLVAGA